MRARAENVFWLLPGRLGGMPHPGSDDAVFERLREDGVGAIVTLTRRPLQEGIPERHGFQYLHLPVRDFSAPDLSQVQQFVRFCDRQSEAGRAVVVHCMAGIGRTGVMLACYLVHLGTEPLEAVRRVRRVRPGALETAAQEEMVYEFAAVESGRAS